MNLRVKCEYIYIFKLKSNHLAYRAEKPRGRTGFSQTLISTFTYPQNFDVMSAFTVMFLASFSCEALSPLRQFI